MTFLLTLLLAWLAFNTAMLGLLWWLSPLASCRRLGHVWYVMLRPTEIYLVCLICDCRTPGWQLFSGPDGVHRLEARR